MDAIDTAWAVLSFLSMDPKRQELLLAHVPPPRDPKYPFPGTHRRFAMLLGAAATYAEYFAQDFGLDAGALIDAIAAVDASLWNPQDFLSDERWFRLRVEARRLLDLAGIEPIDITVPFHAEELIEECWD